VQALEAVLNADDRRAKSAACCTGHRADHRIQTRTIAATGEQTYSKWTRGIHGRWIPKQTHKAVMLSRACIEADKLVNEPVNKPVRMRG
jgi:hypothetical protein